MSRHALRRRYGRAATPISAWHSWRTSVELFLSRRFVADGMHPTPARTVAANIAENETAELKKLHARGVAPFQAAMSLVHGGAQ